MCLCFASFLYCSCKQLGRKSLYSILTTFHAAPFASLTSTPSISENILCSCLSSELIGINRNLESSLCAHHANSHKRCIRPYLHKLQSFRQAVLCSILGKFVNFRLWLWPRPLLSLASLARSAPLDVPTQDGDSALSLAWVCAQAPLRRR